MYTEFEAKFANINKEAIREKLKSIGAELTKPEFMQKRVTFNLPKKEAGKWLRVRDEGDKITLSYKHTQDGDISNQKEIELKVDDYDQAAELLEIIGCEKKAYQETLRELWTFQNVAITIDEWPFLEPIIEIEGTSEEEVKEVAEKLGFDYSKAIFGAITQLYAEKYSITHERINQNTPLIKFDMKNPFED
jgi:adenylate cyclase class 2